METQKFEEWAIVEMFGHQRLAGRVGEQTVGGCSFVRVDVPETKSGKGFTKLLGQGAIYAITVTDETTARALAEHDRYRPMEEWTIEDLIKRRRLPAATEEEPADPGDGIPI